MHATYLVLGFATHPICRRFREIYVAWAGKRQQVAWAADTPPLSAGGNEVQQFVDMEAYNEALASIESQELLNETTASLASSALLNETHETLGSFATATLADM